MTDPSSIHVDQFIAHPPQRVWHALTDPDLLGHWLMKNDFQLVRGHRFTFRTDAVPSTGFDGTVHCEVLDYVVGRSLRISWVAGGVDTTVTWRLEPEGSGTRLFLDHEGFDPDSAVQQTARRILDGGWRSKVMRRLEECVATVG